MLTVANPIYDVVFKYLMEDERIARTILSALLKKEVVKVEVRPHEYTDSSRDKISMFRLDFAATVEETDGSQHLVLIELQKTWLPTETLRFRQYLGVQYGRRDNILADGERRGCAIPMVAIYILGHCIGDIEEPVFYVHGKPYDYDGNELTKGMPDPFVESLTHDSIFVQIPLLKGRFNNRLERVLSVFDQSRKSSVNPQNINIDEREYANDGEMMHLLHRLCIASNDFDTREKMNSEDLYFEEIENRDTLILQKDKLILQKDKQIAKKDEQLAEKNEQLAEKNEQLAAQQDALLSMAKALLAGGMPMEQVAKMSNLPLETVQKIARP